MEDPLFVDPRGILDIVAGQEGAHVDGPPAFVIAAVLGLGLQTGKLRGLLRCDGMRAVDDGIARLFKRGEDRHLT